MAADLTSEQLDALRSFDSPTIANAIEAFEVRGLIEGFMGLDIKCRFPDMGVMLGYAVTATADSMTPRRPKDRRPVLELWRTLEASPNPAVLVFQDVGPKPLQSCHFGDNMAHIAMRLGALGLITNGGVRDLEEVEAIGFQYFAAGTVVSHGNHGIVDVSVPVVLSGVRIEPGDLIHSDKNGVVVIPGEIAEVVAKEAMQVRERESKIVEFVDGPDFSLDGLAKMYGL